MLKNHLPNEILFTIFKQLKHEEVYEGKLAQCILTCRQWRQPAQAALYSALTISSTAVLDAIMSASSELGNFVQSITYRTSSDDKLSMTKMALLFKNLVNFHCTDHSDDLFPYLLCLLKRGSFPALQTIPTPGIGGIEAVKNYNACIELMKDRLLEITLTNYGEETGTYFSLREKLDSFPKLKTIRMYNFCYGDGMICDDSDAVSTEGNIKTLWIQPCVGDNFSFVAPVIPEPAVEMLTVDHQTCLPNTFMLYVMKKFPHLKKLEVLMNYIDCIEYYSFCLTDKTDLVLFLKYLSSIETATGIFFI